MSTKNLYWGFSSTHYIGIKTLSDFENEIAQLNFVIFCTCQKLKMIKHNEAIKTDISSQQNIFTIQNL